jgi:hypothetical protein
VLPKGPVVKVLLVCCRNIEPWVCPCANTLHSYIHHSFLLFNPISIDEVCVQATHLENRGKYFQEDPTKKPSSLPHKPFNNFKRKEKKTAIVKREEGNPSCTHCKKSGHDDEHCWKLHPKKIPKHFDGKGKTKIVATVQQYLGSIQEMKERSKRLEYKVKIPFMLVQIPIMNLMMMNERGMNYFI